MSDFVWYLYHGDCLEVLNRAPVDYFDAMITDPPGGTDFMKQVQQWDSNRGGRELWVEWLTVRLLAALKVCKPGAFGAVWSHQRTTHWTGLALENAGWEIHGQVYHLYAQGMGRNHKLKPAVEPWYVIRKPLSEKSEEANLARWGVGKLDVERNRIPRDRADVPGWHKSGAKGSKGYLGTDTFRIRDMNATEVQQRCGDKDRWPANLYLGDGGPEWLESETAGSSRFFAQARFIPKPTRKERELGCDHLPDRILHRVNPGGLEREERFAPIPVKNHHTTCKPIALMRWLCRLFVPENGLILDPFAGAATTGCAAVRDRFRFVGIESDLEYHEIGKARLQHWSNFESEKANE